MFDKKGLLYLPYWGLKTFYGFLCGFPTSDNGQEFYFELCECF